jgi:hypothetical protein
MPTRPKCRSYEELIAGRYGKVRPSDTRTADDVVRQYYGRSRPAAGMHVLSVSHDDGELLCRRGSGEHIVFGASAETVEEYVVTATPEPVVSHPVDEILLPQPTAAAAPAPAPYAPPEPAPPAPTQPPPDAAPPSYAPAPVPAPVPLAAPAADADAAPPAAPASTTSIDEEELAADMQAILSGQKVYDPASGRTVARDEAAAPPRRDPPSAPPPPQPTGEVEIFDRIAESMRYANAYELGSVELENRFADFDRMDDLKQRDREATPSGDAALPEALPSVPSADFLRDLDAVRASGEAAGAAAARRAADAMLPPSLAKSLTGFLHGCGPTAPNLGIAAQGSALAESMFDAGEHARAGGDHYEDQLRVGVDPGVRFSYGELLAMGDLYATADDMQRAGVSELTALKGLIRDSTRYYVEGKRDDTLDVKHKQWDDATGKRYRKLAEVNFEHFAPDTLFGTTNLPHGNHRTEWESYHRAAIAEAQRLAALPENRSRSYIPETALVISAFGDHFLTDAFASGHLVNKDVVLQRFKAAFYSGSSLTDAAKQFFERLANKAFVGEVRAKFSPLEITTRDFNKAFIKWNVDTPNAFRKLLVQIAEQEPDEVANLALKAVHDHLNEHGIQVVNGAGDPQWKLMGDGHLDGTTLAIMKKAVDQSIANINDPAIQVSGLDTGPLLERVWRFTPRLTSASHTEVRRLVEEFTNPRSAMLVDGAAEIIRKQVDYMVDVLVNERHALQHE